ncbi:YL1 nuclear [Cordyceps militaris]|uniref:YL1 nuclear n=1 Tax=Cordyceps militaris TaxID=73501 RepID=A0A2H4SM20_CORMI|nr:YL1 nuclear [Cordyceps militaris]
MDSELTRPSELDESQSSKLSSVHASDMDSGSGSDSDSSNDGASEAAPQVEWLATGRQRRSTAGNRMKSMLANEEPDSDLELLFAEDENDQGFSDAGEHASDVQMDSSSDDDDNHDDELEGEKELDKQAKERRMAQRKRKAQEAVPAKFRKKVRIDTSNSTPRSSVAPSTPQTASQPRPKKKSERASWLPSVTDLPTRASSRQTTRLSKEQLHAQMEEREAKRLKQLAQMQKKAARLDALKKPPMTQEDRLREAALVEERNSKSLNRWEVAEKQREEERRAKLAALHERTLRGPVLSFWSGMGRFRDGWRKGEGIHVAVEEKPKKARKEKAAKDKGKKKEDAKGGVKEENTGETKPTNLPGASDALPQSTEDDQPGSGQNVEVNANASADVPKQDAAADNVSKDTTMTDAANAQTQEPTASTPAVTATKRAADSNNTDNTTIEVSVEVATVEVPEKEGTEKTTVGEGGSQAITSRPSEVTASSATQSANVGATSTKEPPVEAQAPLAQPKEYTQAVFGLKSPGAPVTAAAEAADGVACPDSVAKETQSQPTSRTEIAHSPDLTTGPDAALVANGLPILQKVHLPPIENESLPASKMVSRIQSEAATPQPEQALSPLDGLATTRDAIIFQNFDESAIKDRGVQTQVLFGRKMGRLSKPTPVPICPITNNPARYRDPKTSLHFYSAAAYKELQRVQSGEYRWSRLLGAWAGSGSYAARGVPERFLNPARCPNLDEVQRIERKREDKEKLKLQQAEDGKKAKETKTVIPNKQAGGGGGGGGDGSPAMATEDAKTVISVKAEETSGAKTEAPVAA